MALVSVYPVAIEWGDCDPAQIVFYPKYFEWFDAAMTALLEAGGWPYARLHERFGIIGLPLAEASARFLHPNRFRQRFEIESSVERWEERRFTVLHQAYRDDVLLLEGRETRICGKPHPDDAQRLHAIPIPPQFKEAFEK
ncbi:MAG TPA: thioesterase family protein [Burkholderiales bacterium]|jgi:4-hydroxybenzoyl-CoA thioesterase